jgi:hypothetical protein
MRRSLLALTCLLSLGAAGCQSQNLAQREQRAKQQICSQLADAAKALDQVAALKPTSTVGEAAAADRALGTALAALERSEQKLEQLRLQNFRTQLKGFKADVAKVASDKKQTLEQAAVELKAKAQPVLEARRALTAAVKCEEPATAPAKP